MRSITRYGFRYGFGVAVGLAVQAACVSNFLDPNHCEALQGDETCREKYDDGRVFCSESTCAPDAFDGCVKERPAEDVCYAACGGEKTLDQDPECEGAAEGSSSSVSETQADSATEPTGGPTTAGSGSMSMSGSQTDSASSGTTASGCTSSLECADPAAPICDGTVCVPCSMDAECLDRDPSRPACTDEGACVACTPSNAQACEGMTPVCDGAVNECVGCRFHEECESGACELATGACFDGACVVQVDGDGPGDETTVSAAIADGCIVVVHAAAGGYPESVAIDGGITVAILAAPGESPTVLGEGANGLPGFDISGDATVYMQGLDVSGNDGGGVGILVDGASVWLDRTVVGANSGGGIALTGSADGHLRNCFVGGDVSDVAAVDATGSSVDILYTTIGGGFGGAAALRCSGTGTIDVRNSLLVARTDDPEIDCATDSLVTSATEAELGDMNTNWFTAGGFAAGDFHLSASAPAQLLTTAQWMTGDPATDIDGDLRPGVNATADVAGADVP